MKGLEIPKFPNRFCSLWLVCLSMMFVGATVMAAEESSSTVEQIEQERSAQINSATAISVEAAQLAQKEKYSEAGIAYAKSLAMLEVLPGEYAAGERVRVEQEYVDMKTVWANSIMSAANEMYKKGEYASAIQKASDALFVDEAKIDEINAFIARAQEKIKTEQFKKETDILTIAPKILTEEEQIDLLFRQATVLERAHRYSEAETKLESIFLIDPLNWEANVRLRKLYNTLYGTGQLQSDSVCRAISADASWSYVPQVVANRVDVAVGEKDNERSGASDLYKQLEKILVTADYQEESILDVIDEQNRNLLRGAPDSRASIILQFPHQMSEKLQPISLQVVDIPLVDLLRYVCLQADLKMSVEANAIVLGLSNMDDLSTRRFRISAEIIQDIAESPNPYYHLGNVLTATEAGNGSGGRGGAAGGGMAGGRGGAAGGGMAGGPGQPPSGMGAGGMAGGNAGNTGINSNTGRIDSSMVPTTNEGAQYSTGVSQSLGSMGLSMSALGIDTSNDGGDTDRKEMGSVGAPTPPVTTSSLKAYFEKRGIQFPYDSTITYNRRKGEILVTNTVENLRKMEDLLQQLEEVRAPLVFVEAKMVELADNDVKELGFDWFLSANNNAGNTSDWRITGNNDLLRHYDGNDPNSSLAEEKNYKIVNDLKIFPNFGESLFGKNGDVNLSLTVNAIDHNSRTEVLSSPRLLLTSGDMGLIKMVETYTFPESWDAPEVEIDNNTIKITLPVPEFDDGNEIGVVFACRPIVNPDNYTISLYIYPQVTAYLGHDNSNYPVKIEAGTIYTDTVIEDETVSTKILKVPTITTLVNMWMPEFAVREMEVNVQVYDGATVVLGGMTEQYNTTRDDKWPIIGEIPLIGRLFSSQMTEHEKRSLLIFVTARLMNTDGTPWRSREPFGVPDFLW